MKVVALLRGINVGGHKKILMADLRALFADLGFGEVSTYIQSGNVVFGPEGRSEPELVATIGAGIERVFGFEVPVLVRTHEQLVSVVRGSPFGEIDAALQGSRYHVTFLSGPPGEGAQDELRLFAKPSERLVVQGRELYLHCPDGLAGSKLTPDLLERKLGVEATSRNWKSVLKLRDLSAP